MIDFLVDTFTSSSSSACSSTKSTGFCAILPHPVTEFLVTISMLLESVAASTHIRTVLKEIVIFSNQVISLAYSILNLMILSNRSTSGLPLVVVHI